MIDWNLLPFFLAGFAGGLHCLAMCGGLACATCQAGRPMVATLTYNLGRSLSYTLLGLLAGSLGAYALPMANIYQSFELLRWVMGGTMICIGLYISGFWKGLIPIERFGLVLWRRLFPIQATISRLPSHARWLLTGGLWGFIPCTLVYGALLMAFAGGSSVQGALSLFVFALGTMPLMLAMGIMSQSVNSWVRSNHFRQASGILLVLFGLWVCLASWLGHESLLQALCSN